VLRITPVPQKGFGLTVRLEGEVLGPWVAAVRDACTRQGRRPRRLRLDLSSVTFADAAGAHLLRELLLEGAEVAACSRFIAELLHSEI
jgi:anti-anti-sigma regulatory factor